ncbi:hypothetical protein FPV67DRAFT_1449878 [Lyophyllum atratum]|nr:hypothetical protein FPV67DRAFT_1449878 [Lyophyllum atratum]
MSSFINKIRSKISRKGSPEKSQTPQSSPSTGAQGQQEQSSEQPQYSIQPHPAKSNDPADLQRKEGLQSSDPMAAHHAREPHVPSREIQSNLEQPLGRDELRARGEELNKDQP